MCSTVMADIHTEHIWFVFDSDRKTVPNSDLFQTVATIRIKNNKTKSNNYRDHDDSLSYHSIVCLICPIKVVNLRLVKPRYLIHLR